MLSVCTTQAFGRFEGPDTQRGTLLAGDIVKVLLHISYDYFLGTFNSLKNQHPKRLTILTDN
jgi:hypothetical protein